MRIELTNGYFVEVDPMNHTLKKKHIAVSKKDGSKKEVEKVCGYFSNLENAVKKFLQLNQIDLLSDTAVSLQGYLASVETINQMAVQTIKRIVEGQNGKG